MVWDEHIFSFCHYIKIYFWMCLTRTWVKDFASTQERNVQKQAAAWAERLGASLHPGNPDDACRQVLAMFWCNGNVWPTETEKESHNYKALTGISDPSPQHLKGRGKFLIHRERNSRKPVKKRGKSQRRGWEQSYGERSHGRALTTETQQPGAPRTSHSLLQALTVLPQHLANHPFITLCNQS